MRKLNTLKGGESVKKKVFENMDYSELRGKIRAKFKRQGDFAKALGMDASSLSKKLNNRTQWTRPEIEKACELLDIPLADAHLYFFCVTC